MGKPMEIGRGKQLKYTREHCYNCNKEGHTARYCPKEWNCYNLPWIGLLISGDAGCHRWRAMGVSSDTSGKV